MGLEEMVHVVTFPNEITIEKLEMFFQYLAKNRAEIEYSLNFRKHIAREARIEIVYWEILGRIVVYNDKPIMAYFKTFIGEKGMLNGLCFDINSTINSISRLEADIEGVKNFVQEMANSYFSAK